MEAPGDHVLVRATDPARLDAAKRRRAIIAIFLLAGSWAVVGGLYQPLLPLYIASIGGQASDVGLAQASHALAMIFSEPLWGLAGDRGGAAVPLVASRLLAGAAIGGLLLSSELWWVFLVQFIRGLFDVALAPIGRAMLGTLLPKSRRATAMAAYYTTNQFGRGGVGFIGGGIVDTVGFRALFAICASITAASAAIAFFGLRRAPRIRVEAPSEPLEIPRPVRTRAQVLRPFLAICAVTMFGVAAQSGWRTFLPLYAATEAGLSAGEVGWLFTIGGVTVLAFTLPGGHLSDRIGRRPLLLAGITLAMLPTASIALAEPQTFVALAGLMVVGSLANAAFNPARTALLSDIAPAGREGLTIGFYGTAEDIGLLLGPLSAGILWDLYGPAVAFGALAVVSATALAGAFFMVRES